MRKRRTRPAEDLILVGLIALVVVQLYFVLTGGTEAVVPVSRRDNEIALQGRDPGVPQHDQSVQEIGHHPQPVVGQPQDPLAGGPQVGGVAVGLGESAPVNLPDRAGLPKVPQGLTQPGQGAVSGSRVPGSGTSYGHGALRFGYGGADPYRQMLLAVYLLERKGGEYALTQAQARHMLTLIRQMEDVKEAVPRTQALLLSTLTQDQLDFIQAQRAVAESTGQRLTPDSLDEYAQAARRALAKGGS